MKKKRKSTTILLIVVFLAGLSLLLYPTVSNYINSKNQTKVINSYIEAVSAIDEVEYQKLYDDAVSYNAEKRGYNGSPVLTEDELDEYNSLLDLTGTGVMGYIDIPTIGVTVPIYHGTDDTVLQVGVGHLEWTSLPVGGLGTHCVLSGHRGLPSSKLFTELDDVSEGDVFTLRVLNEVLTYEVDQILIIDPDVTDPLQIVEGKDYCTLVTCTPYGINTHRLLVRGHRIETVEEREAVRISADCIQVEELIAASVMAVPILLIFLIVIFMDSSRRKRRNSAE